jgi:hypothetical protein
MSAVEPSRPAARRLRSAALALLAFAALAAGCSNTTTPSTTSTTTTAPSGPGSETLKGLMAHGGEAIRTFTATQPGTVTVLLASVDPPLTLGLGVGITGGTGVPCSYTQTVNTAAGSTPQLSVAVDAGTYCAGAYDLGTVGPQGAIVTITVSHP